MYGEHQLGAAKGYSHAIGIFIGTGIGGALVLNNQLYKGSSGGAGEIGHILVDPGWARNAAADSLGCFEAMASRLSIATEAAGLCARQKAAADLLGRNRNRIVPTAIKSGALAESTIRSGSIARSQETDST